MTMLATIRVFQLSQQLPLKMASFGIIKQMNMNRHVENR
jgi:hypothetical protein